MKLIGSKTEQDFRDELLQSHKSLFDEHSDERLLDILRATFPNMRTAYTIGWILDQDTDFYTILVDANVIVCIELDRCNRNANPMISTTALQGYIKTISKAEQIKLTVAIDLAQKDLAKCADRD